MSYQRHTHNRAQRYGGHTKHSWECICGRVVSGNGGKQHFKLEGHRRLTRIEEEARHAERLEQYHRAARRFLGDREAASDVGGRHGG